MPDMKIVPHIQEADMEREPLKTGLDELSEAYALGLVNQTFQTYSTVRAQNHEQRWLNSDALYLGYIPQKRWEGTTVPRASVSVEVVFDQVESALPAVMGALFPQDDWFQIDASHGGKPEEARKLKEYISYLLSCDKEGNGLSFTAEVEQAIKDLLIKGNGGLFLEWDISQQRPIVTYADVKDIYVDHGLRGPNIDMARSVIRRSFLTVEELHSWKGAEGVSIPDKDQLSTMSWDRFHEPADSMRDAVKSLQGQSTMDDMLPLPSDRKIEVLTYYSKSRMIIVLGRKWVAYNEENKLGFIPFVFAPCYIVNGQFYARSVADVQEGNQRAMEGLLNARLDHVSLAMNPPRIQKASSLQTPAQQRWRPGAVYKAGDPKNDFLIPQLSDTTTNVWEEIGFLERLSEKRTGINGGNLRPGNANRTATGINFQAQGSAIRLQTIVQHLEDYLIVPLLYKIQKMIKTFGREEYQEYVYQGEQKMIPKSVIESNVTFSMKAASTMLGREKLMQQFPFILQYLANGTFVSAINAQGLTVNWPELLSLMQDATGLGKMYELVRPMNDQEKQALNQPPPIEMMKMQQQQASNQTRLQMGQMKVQGDIQKEMIKKQPDPMEAQMDQQKFQMEMAKMQMKLEHEKAMAEVKLASVQQEAALKLRIKEMEAQLKQINSARDMQFQEEKNVREMAMDQQRSNLEIERMKKEAQEEKKEKVNGES